MEFRKVTVDEFNYVSALCVDPGLNPEQRDAMKNHMENRINWLKKMMSRGLGIIVALENPKSGALRYPGVGTIRYADLTVKGKVPKGLIEYLPIETALEPVKGEKSLFINCIWILPPFWKKGVAKGLMQRFIKEAEKCGGATVLAYKGDKWFGFFEYMPASFFQKFGFEEISRDETCVLLHLDLGAGKLPMLIPPKKKVVKDKDEILMDVFCNSQCPWWGWVVNKIRRNTRKYSDVTLNVINTDRRDVIEKFGMARGIRINGEPIVKRIASWKEIESALNKFTNRNVHG